VSHRPLIVLNPTAGNGRASRLEGWIRERLALRPDVELRVTTRRGEAQDMAAGARAQGFTRVVAVGGDGTVQEVVNGTLDDAASGVIELGVVAVGTGNDLARSLGLPRDPAQAWTVALGSETRLIDAGRATNGAGESRWFTSAGGLGFDAQVAAAMADRRGWQASQAGYLLTTLSELRRFDNRVVRGVVDGEPLEQRVLFVAFANGEYYGGGMRIAPGARPDDGCLDLCIAGDVSRMTALRQLGNLYRGTHVRHPAVTLRQATSITLDADAPTPVHLDGEPFGTLPLHVEVVPGALTIAASAATMGT